MSSHESWVLRIESTVLKASKKIPRRDAAAIRLVIKLLSIDPYSGDTQKIKGEANTWRRRIGNYRLFYRIFSREKIILVFRLERRTSKTY